MNNYISIFHISTVYLNECAIIDVLRLIAFIKYFVNLCFHLSIFLRQCITTMNWSALTSIYRCSGCRGRSNLAKHLNAL